MRAIYIEDGFDLTMQRLLEDEAKEVYGCAEFKTISLTHGNRKTICTRVQDLIESADVIYFDYGAAMAALLARSKKVPEDKIWTLQLSRNICGHSHELVGAGDSEQALIGIDPAYRCMQLDFDITKTKLPTKVVVEVTNKETFISKLNRT